MLVGHVAPEVMSRLPRHLLHLGLGDVPLVVVSVDVGRPDVGLARGVCVGGLVGHFGCSDFASVSSGF